MSGTAAQEIAAYLCALVAGVGLGLLVCEPLWRGTAAPAATPKAPVPAACRCAAPVAVGPTGPWDDATTLWVDEIPPGVPLAWVGPDGRPATLLPLDPYPERWGAAALN